MRENDKIILDQLLGEIKKECWSANFEPQDWVRVEEATRNLFNYVNRIPEEAARDQAANYVVFTIASDMLLSYVICIQGNTDRIASEVLFGLERIDKKWIGPYDEEMAANLIDISRWEMTNILNGFSYLELLQCLCGLSFYGYFKNTRLAPGFDDISFNKKDLFEYLVRGTYMDSDEHSAKVEFKPGIFGDLHSDANKLIYDLYAAGGHEIITKLETLDYVHSYNHNDIEQRLAVRETLSKYLTKRLVGVLLDGDIRQGDMRWLLSNIVGYYNSPEEAVYNAMSPICDIVVRMVLEGHLMSSLIREKLTTMALVKDTIHMRRIIENERTYLEYQNNIGKEDQSYAGRNRSIRNRTGYVGQGMWGQE